MLAWLRSQRKSFNHVSVHQTLLGKAIFEHAEDAADIAAVAASSSLIRNSSLGPNFLALTGIDQDSTYALFSKVFIPISDDEDNINKSNSTTLQFTQSLKINPLRHNHNFTNSFLHLLVHETRYFSRSLQYLEMDHPTSENLLLLQNMVGLHSLILNSISHPINQGLRILDATNLPNLVRLRIKVVINSQLDTFTCDAEFFQSISKLENNLHFQEFCLAVFQSFTVERNIVNHWAFGTFFCKRLLSKNRLRILELPKQLLEVEECCTALEKISMSKLEILQLIGNISDFRFVSSSMSGLKRLSMNTSAITDVDLIEIGDTCLLLEELVVGCFGGNVIVTGIFLRPRENSPASWRELRELVLSSDAFLDENVTPAGWARLEFLTQLRLRVSKHSSRDTGKVAMTGCCVQHLLFPERLESLALNVPRETDAGPIVALIATRTTQLSRLELQIPYWNRRLVAQLGKLTNLAVLKIEILHTRSMLPVSAVLLTLSRTLAKLREFRFSDYEEEDDLYRCFSGELRQALRNLPLLKSFVSGPTVTHQTTVLRREFPGVSIHGPVTEGMPTRARESESETSESESDSDD